MILASDLPLYFDGAKFADKYQLDSMRDFCVDVLGVFVCPSLPDLTLEDLADCVSEPLPSSDERLEAAELMIDLLLTDTQGGA